MPRHGTVRVSPGVYAIHYNMFEYPCEQRAPFGAENICVYPITDYQPPPR